KVGVKPVEGLLPPASALRLSYCSAVPGLAGADQRRRAGSPETVARNQGVRQRGLRGEELLVEAGTGGVETLVGTDLGVLQPLGGTGRLLLTGQDRGELAVQLQQPFALFHNLRARIAPLLAPQTEFVTPLQQGEGPREFPLLKKSRPEIDVAAGP